MRRYKVIAGSDLARFNRDVVEVLQSVSPDHATKLNTHGIALGWWHDISWMHSQRYTPGQAALAISKKEISR